jgi:hypothetical protein
MLRMTLRLCGMDKRTSRECARRRESRGIRKQSGGNS